MTYKQHKDKWSNCELCELCLNRKRVVILRGTVPSDVLFVGEAPGDSEDILGSPFKGPAGHLLDRIIADSGLQEGQYAMTNMVCCIPPKKDIGGRKAKYVPLESIEACSERLVETALLCKPKLLIWVGELSAKYGPVYLPPGLVGDPNHRIKIVHPSAILQANIAQKGLMIQRSVVAIAEALEDL
jgi:DNA polymerase